MYSRESEFERVIQRRKKIMTSTFAHSDERGRKEARKRKEKDIVCHCALILMPLSLFAPKGKGKKQKEHASFIYWCESPACPLFLVVFRPFLLFWLFFFHTRYLLPFSATHGMEWLDVYWIDDGHRHSPTLDASLWLLSIQTWIALEACTNQVPT
jgi:hypothetical protein